MDIFPIHFISSEIFCYVTNYRYDIFLVGNLAAYNGYNYESDESVRYTSRITIDPLGHCQSGAEYFHQDLIAGRTLLSVMQVAFFMLVLVEFRL